MKQRKQVERSIGCDTSRLYGTLPQAIAYLQEIAEKHPRACLDEYWPSYESMTMVFSWVEPETDEELAARLLLEQQAANKAAHAAKLEAEQKERLAQYLKLKQEFG